MVSKAEDEITDDGQIKEQENDAEYFRRIKKRGRKRAKEGERGGVHSNGDWSVTGVVIQTESLVNGNGRFMVATILAAIVTRRRGEEAINYETKPRPPLLGCVAPMEDAPLGAS